MKKVTNLFHQVFLTSEPLSLKRTLIQRVFKRELCKIPITQTKKQDMGLIAHELQEVYPFLVNGVKDGATHQSINYTSLIELLIKEMQ